MIVPTIQLPIAVTTQAQIPVESLRVDNQQLPQIPRSSPLFPSVPEKEVAARSNSSPSSINSSQGAATGSERAKIGTADDSETGTETGKESNQRQNHAADAEIQQQITQLASRDREVRAHERAHSSVGGQFTGAPNFTFTKGPNGVFYATSGEVSISTSEVSGDPQASLAKLETVIRAALAPADPSAQDLRVAASAAAAVQRLKAEIGAQARETQAEDSDIKTNLNDEETENQQTANLEETSSPQQRLQQRFQSLGVFNTEQAQPLLQLIA